MPLVQPQKLSNYEYCSRQLHPDLSETKKFLQLLSGTKNINETNFTFQIFSDHEDLKNNGFDPSAKILNGTLSQHVEKLTELNRMGAGIFVTINETDGLGRKNDNITRVRANFADLDGAPLAPVEEYSLLPHIINETSSGRFHAIYLAVGEPLDQFHLIQKGISQKFNSDLAVNDLPRVIRIPGFYNNKKEPFIVRILKENPAEPHQFEKLQQSFPFQSHPTQKKSKEFDNLILEGKRNTTLASLAHKFHQHANLDQ